jgi:glycine/D-amino acid oxidase-like deaminating enzyme
MSLPQPPQPIVDVIIVGCGPVGAYSALLLRSMGMRCLVIERDTVTCAYPRAVALDGDAARLLGLVSPHLSAWLHRHVLPCHIDIRNGSPCGTPPHLPPLPLPMLSSRA